MNGKTGALLVGAGFLLGTAGVKALTSKPAKNCYTHVVAGALRVKQGYDNIVEQAKAEVDDIVAEANYLNSTQDETAAESGDTPEASAATA